ncbi:sensor histidine kinase inhibitor, KipI family [Desulfacinum hydrothermale DSM 13146]|uniref:Sensor histidine kinase inhibitor, KipI family n=1 Tax=Desulfacinum hydrothermale DSM 13146 TaxID=1121390 RepID=A0A1W1XP48_9BACT|nr:5-oxoprolinase subunit PxpB [Desulfacinum hydrothermale]SMC25291.1 sensor histidine kinase inhibitor, KipI family [Desulfacinum hydrothermale DSM 13146]
MDLADEKDDSYPRFLHCGDMGLLVELGNAVDPSLNRRVHALGKRLRGSAPGILSLVPTYRSLFIHYDPTCCSYERIIGLVQENLASLSNDTGGSRVVKVPVCYGGHYGPDLAQVAAIHGLTEHEVIEKHAGRRYHVYMVGFTPGFPYMGGLNPELHTPRRKQPRTRVPAGSVGIAEEQTGIYPIESPGGWQIIGRTPLRLFDVNRVPPFLVEAGDTVVFEPITKEQFERLAHR